MKDNSGTLKREKLGRTASYYGAFITLGFVMGVIGPTLPGLAENTGTTLSRISYLFSMHGFGYFLGSLLGGQLYDRIRGHPIIGGALVFAALAMAVIPSIPFLWVLTGIFFLMGVCTAAIDVGGNTLIVWVHGNEVGPYMNGLHFFFGLGAFLAPIVVARSIGASGHIDLAYYILAGVTLPISFFLFKQKSPAPLHKPGEDGGKTGNVLQVVLIALFLAFHVGGELSYGGWVYTYAVTRGLADKTQGAYLTSVYWGALTLGRLVGALAATRMKPGRMLLVDIAGSILAAGVVLFFQNSAPALWAGSALLGFSIASLFASSINFAEEGIGITGRVASFLIVGAGVGSMFFPWFIGQIFESRGPRIMPFSVLLMFIGAGVVLAALFILRVRRNR